MLKKLLLLLTVVSTAILLYSCSAAGATAANKESTQPVQSTVNAAKEATTVTVTIKDYKFDPANITINKGDTVVWINKDSMAHTATGDKFDSGNLNNGASFKFTFNEAGDFSYVCSYHPNMKGKVTVK